LPLDLHGKYCYTTVVFSLLPMADMQEQPAVSGPQDLLRDADGEQKSPPYPAVVPKNQQDYWRWIQLQVLREREGKSALRE